MPIRTAKAISPILLSAVFALGGIAQQPAAGTPQVLPLHEVTPEERRKIEAALPAKAIAKPHVLRKLLVVDYHALHPSVPVADLAVGLMGVRTGAYETVICHDTSFLAPYKLQQFDAVYLNNTVGDVFNTPMLREGFAAYMRTGGGLVGNHATSVTSPDWPEFGEILGATGAVHRLQDEKVVIKPDDPSHPVDAMFGGKSFELTERILRFNPPSPRSKVHVLLSIDLPRTDMNQVPCTGNCASEDGDYPISWVRSYGKGRVFYCSLGHHPEVFWDPRILQHFLAGIQFALGDLKVNTKPSASPASGR